jgi:hypothetical protein
VEENDDGTVEVSAVNPVASMQAVSNDRLRPIAEQVKSNLEKVINRL